MLKAEPEVPLYIRKIAKLIVQIIKKNSLHAFSEHEQHLILVKAMKELQKACYEKYFQLFINAVDLIAIAHHLNELAVAIAQVATIGSFAMNANDKKLYSEMIRTGVANWYYAQATPENNLDNVSSLNSNDNQLRPPRTIEHNTLCGLAFLPSGHLLSWGSDFTIRMWDKKNDTLIMNLQLASLPDFSKTRLYKLLTLKNGKILTVLYDEQDNRGNTHTMFALWNLNTVECEKVLKKIDGRIECINELPDGRIIWSELNCHRTGRHAIKILDLNQEVLVPQMLSMNFGKRFELLPGGEHIIATHGPYDSLRCKFERFNILKNKKEHDIQSCPSLLTPLDATHMVGRSGNFGNFLAILKTENVLYGAPEILPESTVKTFHSEHRQGQGKKPSSNITTLQTFPDKRVIIGDTNGNLEIWDCRGDPILYCEIPKTWQGQPLFAIRVDRTLAIGDTSCGTITMNKIPELKPTPPHPNLPMPSWSY